MSKPIRLLLLILVSTGTVTTQSSCNHCSPDRGGIFYQGSLGTWRLIRIESPSRNQTQFSEPQTLKIALEADSRGNSVARETLRSDTTTVERLEWDTVDLKNCRQQSFVVIYDNRQQRKYWLSEQGQTLRATGYVDELGSKADTLMYFYERVP
ncbi:hypothetical protein [Telluribacter sp.]|uniref:hypothetical protein n=1 Tax=Telluribacter sp. TaxID=1978767 RepID=UPI002E0FD331|nr:hypothetical protein [Telluribacter sp.]